MVLLQCRDIPVKGTHVLNGSLNLCMEYPRVSYFCKWLSIWVGTVTVYSGGDCSYNNLKNFNLFLLNFFQNSSKNRYDNLPSESKYILYIYIYTHKVYIYMHNYVCIVILWKTKIRNIDTAIRNFKKNLNIANHFVVSKFWCTCIVKS